MEPFISKMNLQAFHVCDLATISNTYDSGYFVSTSSQVYLKFIWKYKTSSRIYLYYKIWVFTYS